MQWLYSLPRTLFVSLVILVGIAFIILNSPPKDICYVQEETYKKNHIGFLFLDPKKKFKHQTFYQKNLKNCRQTNSPGGCYSLFHSVDRLISSFRSLKLECHQRISQIKEVREALLGVYSLFVEISWGSGQDDGDNLLGWLSYNDVSTYCKVKNQILYLYESSLLDQLHNSLFMKVAEGRSFEDFQRFSILSEDCYTYPQ